MGRTPGSKNKKTVQPASAPASTANVEIRDQIKNMSGFPNEEALSAVIPESTATSLGTSEDKPRRKYTKRTPVATSEDVETDQRYKDAVARMSSFGGAEAVRTAFNVTGKPLDEKENGEIDDYFYVISKKYSLDATKSGLFLSLYAVLLLLRLIVTRILGVTSINLFEQFQGLFSNEKEKPEGKEQAETA